MIKRIDNKQLTIDELLQKAQQADNYEYSYEEEQAKVVKFINDMLDYFASKGIERPRNIIYKGPCGQITTAIWHTNLFHAIKDFMDTETQSLLLHQERSRLKEEYNLKERELLQENQKQREILNEAWEKLKQYEKSLIEINKKELSTTN